MSQLRTRFGGLLKAHRARLGMTQEALAERAGISTDMVSKIEGGSSGARFGVIEKLAAALGIDPAELFTSELPSDHVRNETLMNLTSRLAALSKSDLEWIEGIIQAALKKH